MWGARIQGLTRVFLRLQVPHMALSVVLPLVLGLPIGMVLCTSAVTRHSTRLPNCVPSGMEGREENWRTKVFRWERLEEWHFHANYDNLKSSGQMSGKDQAPKASPPPSDLMRTNPAESSFSIAFANYTRHTVQLANRLFSPCLAPNIWSQTRDRANDLTSKPWGV